MNKFINIVFLSLLFSINTPVAADISPAKKKLIDILLVQTGQSGIAVGKQFSNLFIQQMKMALKKSKPDIDPKAFDIVEEEIISIIDEELVVSGALNKMMYPIYDKHFSETELKKMIELNNTEFGKKMIRVMPMVTQEGIQAGQQFGQTLGPKIQQRIISRFKKEGIQ